jgi:hypothetical protein
MLVTDRAAHQRQQHVVRVQRSHTLERSQSPSAGEKSVTIEQAGEQQRERGKHGRGLRVGGSGVDAILITRPIPTESRALDHDRRLPGCTIMPALDGGSAGLLRIRSTPGGSAA